MALRDITEHVVGEAPELHIPHIYQESVSGKDTVIYTGKPYFRGTVTYGIRDDIDRETQLLPFANPRDTYLVPLNRDGVTAPDADTGVDVTSGSDGVLALSGSLPDAYKNGMFFRVGTSGRLLRLLSGEGANAITVEPDREVGTGSLYHVTRLEVKIIGAVPHPFNSSWDSTVTYNYREILPYV